MSFGDFLWSFLIIYLMFFYFMLLFRIVGDLFRDPEASGLAKTVWSILLLFLPFDSLVSLYVIAALFGLFQGGIVPSYAIIIREHFPASEAGARFGLVIMCTLFGMALGGWMSGKVFDLTGSYEAAFLNGIAWNALNLTIAFFLLYRTRLLTGRGARVNA